MKKIIYLIIFSIFSCSDKSSESIYDQFQNDEIGVATSGFIKNDIENYTSLKFEIFKDSLDSMSGFLSWKDERDIWGLGKETQGEKVQRVWNGVFKLDSLKKIVNENIKLLKIEKGLPLNSEEMQLVESSIIKEYVKKVHGSLFLSFIEDLLDKLGIIFAGGVFLAIASKEDFFAVIIIEIIILAIFFYLGHRWEVKLENQIKNDIVTNYMAIINKTIETIINKK
ncbi:hypothetical protein [Algibacter lectus]|uniref:hypothetical protein n=1 Tax=Algibacter lectus TaxID=221126 RepID=UPI0026F21584|nr:hypothetical protein [Algibacter lectus]MDO7138288.1 hypothetical protein [Algibacter lectus]